MELDIPKVDQTVACDIHLLPRLEHSILLELEEMRANHPNGQEDQSQVHQIAPIALPVAIEKHIHSIDVRLAMAMTHTRSTPDFIENGGSGKSTDSKADIGHDIGNTSQRENKGAQSCEQGRETQIAPQSSSRGTPPCQQRTNTHSQDQHSQ